MTTIRFGKIWKISIYAHNYPDYQQYPQIAVY